MGSKLLFYSVIFVDKKSMGNMHIICTLFSKFYLISLKGQGQEIFNVRSSLNQTIRPPDSQKFIQRIYDFQGWVR
jgi:hypothetical protein